MSSGEIVEVPVYVDELMKIHGLQLTMELHQSAFTGIRPGVLDIQSSDVGILRDDLVTLSFAGLSASMLKPGEVAFTILIKSQANSRLSKAISFNSKVTRAEAYDEALAVAEISWTCRNTETFIFKVFQNEPNPFRSATTITYTVDKKQDVTLKVFDQTGRLLLQKQLEATAGINQVELKKEELMNSGVMYYTITAGENTETRKMILIE